MWRLCRGAESKQARELALALALAQECASIPEIARAYERMASHRVAEARYEEAIAMARQAREMAEQLGLTDVISDALDTEAKAIRGRAGDWAMLMEAALESALSGGHEEQAGRAFAGAYMCIATISDPRRPSTATGTHSPTARSTTSARSSCVCRASALQFWSKADAGTNASR
jgi:hypothetical protein